MKTPGLLWNVVFHPSRTSREILALGNLRASGTVVLVFALVLSLLFLVSHFVGDYPPPAGELETWIEAWGEFAMLPFVKIPAESYRLALAIVTTPLVLAIWILMAGSARMLSLLFGGRVTFEQYLNLFGFSFFAFWILGHLLDILYSNVLGDLVLPALRMEYGPLVRGVVASFPAVMWTTVLSLGGLYNGIVTAESESFSLPRAALVGLATFFWPIVLVSVLIR